MGCFATPYWFVSYCLLIATLQDLMSGVFFEMTYSFIDSKLNATYHCFPGNLVLLTVDNFKKNTEIIKSSGIMFARMPNIMEFLMLF